jgi:hypothetical protein
VILRWAALLILLCPLCSPTEMPKKFSERIRFIEPVEVWGTKDALDRNRFMEAFYWASSEFDPGAKLDFQIAVIHGDKGLGEFMRIGAYPGTVFYRAKDTKPQTFEIWMFGKATDAAMIALLSNVFANALSLDDKTSFALGQKAYTHLQSTVSVKQLERK